MTRVIVTTTDGEQHTAACPGVDPADIDVAYIDQRTPYEVETITVDDPDADLATAIRNAGSLDELKSALLGEAGNSNVKARGRRT